MVAKPSVFSRLPLLLKVIFVLFYPVSIPYGIYRMWRTKRIPPLGRWALTAAAVLFFVVMSSGGGSEPAATTSGVKPSATASVSAAASTEDTTSTIQEGQSVEATPEADVAAVIDYETVKVIRIVDGDTVEVEFEDGTTDKVRFIGVDTPESTSEVEIYGEEATEYTTAQLLDRTVYLEYDADTRDNYSRLLAYVWLELPTTIDDGEMRASLFNAQLLLDGYANLMTVQPNSKYVDYLKTYEAEARDANAGLWAAEAEAEAAAAAAAAAAAEAESENQSGASDDDVIVYITNTGEKYHRDGCSSLSKSKIPISLSDAIARGYTPCARCY